MDPKLTPALARRLAAYAATAGITLAVAPAADAQVVYHDFDPDVVVSGSVGRYLDLDDDGQIDFTFEHFLFGQPEQGGGGRGYFDWITLERPSGAPVQNAALVYGFQAAARLPDSYAITPTPSGTRRFARRAVVAYYGSSGQYGAF